MSQKLMSKHSSSIHGKYAPTCNFNGRAVLNLGCGFAKFSARNVVNLDAYEVADPDVIWDLNKTPMPFEDKTFDLILANHILEHLHNWWDCFEDCARILKPRGKLEIWLPGVGSDSQMGFRDHVSIINQNSFWGTWGQYRNAANAWASVNNGNLAHSLKMTGIRVHAKPYWWMKIAPFGLRNWMCEHLRNVIYEMGFFFVKLTPEQMAIPPKLVDGGNADTLFGGARDVSGIL